MEPVEVVFSLKGLRMLSFHRVNQNTVLSNPCLSRHPSAKFAPLFDRAKSPTGQQLLARFIAPRAVTHLVTELGACMVHA